jgi:HTH-type transcriptional regulator/antitoxin HigA
MQKISDIMKELKAIKTEKDYQLALSRLEKNFDIQKDSTANKAEVLMILIQEYERKNYAIEAPTPIEAIKFRMEQMNLKQSDLLAYIGSRSRVSEILNGKRSLTLRMIIALHKGLHIPLESLILNTPVPEKRKKTYSTSPSRNSVVREKKAGYNKKKR